MAIKLEDKSKSNNISILKNETRVLEYLARNGCRTQIPQVFWYGNYQEQEQDPEKNCLVMTPWCDDAEWEDKVKKIIESAKKYCVNHGIEWSAWQEQLILETIEETFLICKK